MALYGLHKESECKRPSCEVLDLNHIWSYGHPHCVCSFWVDEYSSRPFWQHFSFCLRCIDATKSYHLDSVKPSVVELLSVISVCGLDLLHGQTPQFNALLPVLLLLLRHSDELHGQTPQFNALTASAAAAFEALLSPVLYRVFAVQLCCIITC